MHTRHRTNPGSAHRSPLGSVDGVTFHLMRHGEEHLIRSVVEASSPDSRFQRFHTPVPVVPARLVSALSRVAPGEREIVVALLRGRAVGQAEWTRTEDPYPRAEIAALVADAHQGHGIGRALVARVAERAWGAGLREAVLYVRPENRKVRQALGRRGAITVADTCVLPLRALRPHPVVRWEGAVPRPRTSDGHLCARD